MNNETEVRCYEVKFVGDFEKLPGYKVLKIKDKYYHFQRTLRTFKSLYEEVKDELEDLVYLSEEVLEEINIEMFYKESLTVQN